MRCQAITPCPCLRNCWREDQRPMMLAYHQPASGPHSTVELPHESFTALNEKLTFKALRFERPCISSAECFFLLERLSLTRRYD